MSVLEGLCRCARVYVGSRRCKSVLQGLSRFRRVYVGSRRFKSALQGFSRVYRVSIPEVVFLFESCLCISGRVCVCSSFISVYLHEGGISKR